MSHRVPCAARTEKSVSVLGVVKPDPAIPFSIDPRPEPLTWRSTAKHPPLAPIVQVAVGIPPVLMHAAPALPPPIASGLRTVLHFAGKIAHAGTSQNRCSV